MTMDAAETGEKLQLRAEIIDARSRSRLSKPVARPLANGLIKKNYQHWKNEHNRKSLSLSKYQGDLSLMELVRLGEHKPPAKGLHVNKLALSSRQVMHGWWAMPLSPLPLTIQK